MTDIEALRAERATLVARIDDIDDRLTAAGQAPTMTTDDVAQYLGVGRRSVRTVAARMGVAPVGRDAQGGNLYDRARLLAAAAARPGAGARTDLLPKK